MDCNDNSSKIEIETIKMHPQIPHTWYTIHPIYITVEI